MFFKNDININCICKINCLKFKMNCNINNNSNICVYLNLRIFLTTRMHKRFNFLHIIDDYVIKFI